MVKYDVKELVNISGIVAVVLRDADKRRSLCASLATQVTSWSVCFWLLYRQFSAAVSVSLRCCAISFPLSFA